MTTSTGWQEYNWHGPETECRLLNDCGEKKKKKTSLLQSLVKDTAYVNRSDLQRHPLKLSISRSQRQQKSSLRFRSCLRFSKWTLIRFWSLPKSFGSFCSLGKLKCKVGDPVTDWISGSARSKTYFWRMSKVCGSLVPKRTSFLVCFELIMNFQSIDSRLAMNQP
jgi:hypothetical protein